MGQEKKVLIVVEKIMYGRIALGMAPGQLCDAT